MDVVYYKPNRDKRKFDRREVTLMLSEVMGKVAKFIACWECTGQYKYTTWQFIKYQFIISDTNLDMYLNAKDLNDKQVLVKRLLHTNLKPIYMDALRGILNLLITGNVKQINDHQLTYSIKLLLNDQIDDD